jgi:hypothetical protein
MPVSPQWYLSLRFSHQNPVNASPIPHTRYMPHPSHSSRFYHQHNIGWGVQIITLLEITCTKFHDTDLLRQVLWWVMKFMWNWKGPQGFENNSGRREWATECEGGKEIKKAALSSRK